jgi:hypothetical protein
MIELLNKDCKHKQRGLVRLETVIILPEVIIRFLRN